MFTRRVIVPPKFTSSSSSSSLLFCHFRSRPQLVVRTRKMSSSSPPPTSNIIKFGPFEVTDQVFHRSKLSYALVNIKPLVPGHVLVIPYRPIARFTDLTAEEVSDVFATVKLVQRILGVVYFRSSPPQSSTSSVALSPEPLPLPAPPSSTETSNGKSKLGIENEINQTLLKGSFNVAIQDGPESGQTVPHVHVHIIPRLKGNTEGDGIYERLLSEDGNVGGGLWDEWLKERPRAANARGFGVPKVKEEERRERRAEVMADEARILRAWGRWVEGLDGRDGKDGVE